MKVKLVSAVQLRPSAEVVGGLLLLFEILVDSYKLQFCTVTKNMCR